MRDPDSTHSWSNTFAYRVKYQDSHNLLPNYNNYAQPDLDTSPAIVGRNRENDIPTIFDFRFLLPPYEASECKVMRFSSRNLASLRSLPSSSLVLLLTPVLAPAHCGQSEADAKAIDPFESFGRELSKLHRRLRHVPYVPQTGLTSTHIAFIEQAAAVIVVVSEPADSDDEILELQQSVAEDVLTQRADLAGDADVPFVLVRFDCTVSNFDSDEYDDDGDYENVLHAPALSKQSVTKAAQLLFKAAT